MQQKAIVYLPVLIGFFADNTRAQEVGFRTSTRFILGTYTERTASVASGDLDGDGDQDLILANRDAQPNYIYLNYGTLGFGEKIPFGTGNDNIRGVSVADIDQDGLQDILLAEVNQSQLGLYNYNERLLRVTENPKVIIPTHWDNFRLPYGFSQQSSVDLKLLPFKEDVARLSPKTRVIIPEHLGTITIE